jgi:peptide/nickel transport system permease protein
LIRRRSAAAAPAGAADERRPAALGAALAPLAIVALLAGLGVFAGGGRRALEPLDPATASFLPPGATVQSLALADGRELVGVYEPAGEGSWRLRRLGRSEILTSAEVPRRHRYWLGSDRFGRDLLATTAVGARVSMAVAFTAGLLASAFGALVGAAAALGPRWLDAVISRALEAWLAFPPLLAALFLALLIPSSLATVIWILAAVSWMGAARWVRSEVATLRASDWVAATRGLGMGDAALFARHLLPNLSSLLLVDFAQRVGQLVLAEATLSFLGFGVQAPTPSLGGLLAESRGELGMAWWTVLVPGAAILALALGLALVADALRDRFDPRVHRAPSGDHTETVSC